jgi:hypothetical protein
MRKPDKRGPHKNPDYKQNITILACILRLRIQPSVPYPLIAYILLSTLPDLTKGFLKKVAPKEVQSEGRVEEWLIHWLEAAFETAEKQQEGAWKQARIMKEDGGVSEVLAITGLNDQGFGVASEEEVNCKFCS